MNNLFYFKEFIKISYYLRCKKRKKKGVEIQIVAF